MHEKDRTDVIVVGGGLVGSAVALGLAEAGLAVTVLDEGDTAFRASTGNFGLVWVQGKGDGFAAYAEWTRRSADLWPGFAERLSAELGSDIGYRQPGGVHLCLSEQEYAERERLVRRLHNQAGPASYDCKLLDRAETKSLLPGIGPDVHGASYCAHDGHVNPLLLLRALRKAMAARGAIYLPDHPVSAIAKDGDGIRVDSVGKELYSAKVVLAAGLANRSLGTAVSLAIPVSPLKGQIMVTERAPSFLPLPTGVIRQSEEGTVLLGDSHEDVGFQLGSTTPVMASIAARAVRSFPAVKDLRVVRAWAALRIMTPDGCPIYDESTTHPGAFGLACHSGVTLAAAHTLQLAPAIAEGNLGPRFEAFSSERFHVATA